MCYSRKKSKQDGLRIWNFQGFQRNSMCNFRGLIRVISKGDQEKIMCNFQGSLLLALEFSRDVTQFVEYPGVELCFVWNFQG